MNDLIKVSTIVQAKYWLDKGEVLVFSAVDYTGYISMVGGEAEVVVQSKYGLSDTYKSNMGNLDNVLNELLNVTTFSVCIGVKLISKKPTLVQRFMDTFRKK